MTAVSITEGKCKQWLSRVLGEVEGSYRSLISDYVHPIVSSHPLHSTQLMLRRRRRRHWMLFFNGRMNTHAHTKA